MGATNRHIDDLRKRHTKAYWNARLWLGVLNQDTFWVPRGAWAAYSRASLTGVTYTDTIGELDGKPATVAPTMHVIHCAPNFDVEGVVETSDMEIQWRRNVISFLWRRHSMPLCRAMSNATLVTSANYADAPDDVIDEIIETDLRYMALTVDEDARHKWFNDLALIAHRAPAVIDQR